MQVIIYVFSLAMCLNYAHPFFVSICEINQNKTEQTLELTVKIFSEDLEATLKQNTGEKINIGMDSENEKTDNYIVAYLNKNLRLIVDGKEVEKKFLGKEVEEDATWIYLEVDKIKKIKELKVINTILLDYEKTQNNIVNINLEGKQKTMLLNNKKKEDSFKVKD